MTVQTKIDELITLRASEWFEILKDPTEAERAAFIAWLHESRRHLQEFLEVAAVDDAVGGLSPVLREDLSALVARITPPITRLPERAQPRSWTRRLERGRRWKHAVAWSAACAMLVTLIVWTRSPDQPQELSTAIGEQRTFELTDTSVVTLNADSHIQLRLNTEQRGIELRRGEAIFKVARDVRRPFRVYTQAGVVQVLGTQFNVYARRNGDTRVSVIEGRVQLTAADSDGVSPPQTLILRTGEEADIRLNGTIQPNSKPAVDKTVAWRERRLAFSDAPLEDMVTEFNRYNRSPRLRLEGVPPETYRFAGIFDADDPESLAALLSRESDLVVQRSSTEIVIRAR